MGQRGLKYISIQLTERLNQGRRNPGPYPNRVFWSTRWKTLKFATMKVGFSAWEDGKPGRITAFED